MFHAAPGELAAALSDAELARLERERGLFVAHTYLGPSARTTQLGRAARAARGAWRRDGGLAIDPALDAALARVAAHVRAGRLASLAWAEAGDRLRALGDVEVTYRPDGAAEVHNHGGRAGRRRSPWRWRPPAWTSRSRGRRSSGGRTTDGLARLWFDLGAGEKATLRVWDGLELVPLLPRG